MKVTEWKNWNDYLEMLESRYNEYERLQQKKLLMEELHATSEEEIQQLLMSDMLEFTDYMATHTEAFLQDQIEAFASYNTLFSDFLDNYKKTQEELDAMNSRYVETISADDWLDKNDDYLDVDPLHLEDEKKKVEVDLFEIVKNDKSLLEGIESDNKDINEYYDYSLLMKQAVEQGDWTEAIYEAVLRDAKIRGLSGDNAYYDVSNVGSTYDKLQQYLEESKVDDTTRNTLLAQYNDATANAQKVANALAEENLEVDSSMAQAAIQISSYLPVALEEQQAQQLASDILNNEALQQVLNDKSDILSDNIHETTTSITDAINAVSTILSGYIDKETAQSVAEAYASSSSGRYSGGVGYTKQNTKSGQTSTEEPTQNTNTDSNTSLQYDKDTDYSLLLANATSLEEATRYADLRQAKIEGEGMGEDTYITSTGDLLQAWIDNNRASYASGIENGPVTYTGLAMLHGTPSSPEYVLNSDQAGNLLRNLATNKLEYESNLTGCGDTVYDFGGIVMNGVNDPEQFFTELQSAMSRRYNNTKNKK